MLDSHKTKHKPLRVVTYTRVSDARAGQTTENQRLDLMDYVQTHGHKLVCEYADHDRGWKPDRSQLKALLDAVAVTPRRIDLVLFWSLDRLSREGTLKTITYLNHFDSHGVMWKSLTEEYLDSSGMFKDVIVALLASMAKQETTRNSERTKAALRRVKSEGKVLGRVEVAMDMDAARAMVEQGWGMGRIAKALKVSKATVSRRFKREGVTPAGEFALKEPGWNQKGDRE